MRRRRKRVAGARRAPLQAQPPRRAGMGGQPYATGAAGCGAVQNPEISAAAAHRGRGDDERQERVARIRHNRPHSGAQRFRRHIETRVQVLRPGQREISGCVAGLRVVRRGAAPRRLRGMQDARLRQVGVHLRHNDPAQRADVGVRRDRAQLPQRPRRTSSSRGVTAGFLPGRDWSIRNSTPNATSSTRSTCRPNGSARCLSTPG